GGGGAARANMTKRASVAGQAAIDAAKKCSKVAAPGMPAARRRPVQFCAPFTSQLEGYEARVGPKIDSSYISISDLNGSTKLEDVASFIARSIPTRSVTPDAVRRELQIMTSVVTECPIWVHEAGVTDRMAVAPTPLVVHKNGVAARPRQHLPLFFVGRVPSRIRARHTLARTSHQLQRARLLAEEQAARAKAANDQGAAARS